MSYPTPFQRRTLWNAATGVSILILGLLLVGLIWLIGRVFGFLQPVLIPVIVAGIVAYVLEPVVRFLQRRGLSRAKAIISIYGIALAGVAVLVWTLLPGIQMGHEKLKSTLDDNQQQVQISDPLSDEDSSTDAERGMEATLLRELHKLEMENHNGMITWLLTEIGHDGNAVDRKREEIEARDLMSYTNSRSGRFLYRYKDAILETTRDWITRGSTRILGFLGLALGMIMVPIYLFFFLKDSDSIRQNWHKYIPLKASRFKTELVETLQEINGYLVSFFRGQVLVAVIDGLLIGIVLTFFGLPYGFLIGVFMALLGVIPFIGNIICMIPASIIAYLHAAQGNALFGMGPWAYVGCVILIFLVVQQINSLVTAPKIVGDSVGLHPLTVIFSMLFWSLVLGGFIGALIAVPLTAAIKVLFRRFIWVKRIKPDTENSQIAATS